MKYSLYMAAFYGKVKGSCPMGMSPSPSSQNINTVGLLTNISMEGTTMKPAQIPLALSWSSLLLAAAAVPAAGGNPVTIFNVQLTSPTQLTINGQGFTSTSKVYLGNTPVVSPFGSCSVSSAAQITCSFASALDGEARLFVSSGGQWDVFDLTAGLSSAGVTTIVKTILVSPNAGSAYLYDATCPTGIAVAGGAYPFGAYDPALVSISSGPNPAGANFIGAVSPDGTYGAPTGWHFVITNGWSGSVAFKTFVSCSS